VIEISEPDDGAVLAFGDEHEVENSDDALIDEIYQDGTTLAGHLSAREFHDQVADRA
jgi:hypothetical protein